MMIKNQPIVCLSITRGLKWNERERDLLLHIEWGITKNVLQLTNTLNIIKIFTTATQNKHFKKKYYSLFSLNYYYVTLTSSHGWDYWLSLPLDCRKNIQHLQKSKRYAPDLDWVYVCRWLYDQSISSYQASYQNWMRTTSDSSDLLR